MAWWRSWKKALTPNVLLELPLSKDLTVPADVLCMATVGMATRSDQGTHRLCLISQDNGIVFADPMECTPAYLTHLCKLSSHMKGPQDYSIKASSYTSTTPENTPTPYSYCMVPTYANAFRHFKHYPHMTHARSVRQLRNLLHIRYSRPLNHTYSSPQVTVLQMHKIDNKDSLILLHF